jgi:putative CocE/NonD family hydrolase
MRRLPILLLMIWLADATVFLAPARANDPLIHEAALPVPARDGIRLAAHVFRPETRDRLPVILAFTPYAVQELLPRAQYFAAHGYVFVAVSVRGRGDSEGDFTPFSAQDGKDAADAIAWAAAQPWSNGRVGMWGGSYLGYAQWAAAARRPPALRTIVPAAAVFPGVDYPAWRHVNLGYQFQWLAAMQGRSDWFDTAFDDEAWTRAIQAQRREGRAFADLAARAGGRGDIARRWLAASAGDWAAAAGDPAGFAGLDIPVLAITGQFDSDQRGAIAHVRRWLGANPGAARHSYTVIGPWDHGGTRTPRETMAGERVDPQSVIDMNALHLAWYDWTLKDGARPGFLGDQLVYFTLGSGRWQVAPSLDALDEGITLEPAAGAGGGSLLPRAGPARFAYRLDTRQLADANPIGFEAAPADVRDVDALKADGLIFDSAPLAQDMVLSGFPRLSAWLSSSRPGADVFASLILLTPDGQAKRIGFDLVRLSAPQGTRAPDDQVQAVDFDAFGFVSRKLAAGTRIRLALHSNPPAFLEANPGNGGDVAADPLANGGPQVVTLRHDRHRPTRLFLPLLPLPPLATSAR